MTGKPVTFWQISKPAHKQIALSALLAILAAFLSLAPVIVLVELVRTVLPILNGQQINSLRLWLLVLALVVTTLLHGQATVKSLQISHKADGVLGEHLRQRQITKMGK